MAFVTSIKIFFYEKGLGCRKNLVTKFTGQLCAHASFFYIQEFVKGCINAKRNPRNE